MKIICSRTQPKTFLSLQVFQQTNFCVVSERIFALHHFLTAKNCILEKLWKQISIYLLKKILFPRCRKVLSDGGQDGGRLNKFFRAFRTLGLPEYFTIFYYNWNFWKFNHFWNFDTLALKQLNFPNNLDFKGKIVATFLIRGYFLSI